MRLDKIKIATKILLIVGLLAAVAAIIAAVGIRALMTLSAATDEIELAGSETRTGARTALNAAVLNGTEFMLAADPQANLAQVRQIIKDERTKLEERLAELKRSADGEQARLLGDVQTAYDHYRAELDKTLAVAEAVGKSAAANDAQKAVLVEAENSQAMAAALRDALRDYGDYTERKAADFSAAGTQTYNRMKWLLSIVALAGVIIGLALGQYVAKVGVVAPIRRIVAAMGQLAKGDLTTEIAGKERGDEIGEMAAALQVFKDTAAEAKRLDQEARAAAERAAREKDAREAEARAREEQERAREREAIAAREQRARRIEEIIANFTQAVGEVVDSVATGSSQLRTNAEGLSAIAEQTSRQSVAVAAAAEQASTNVETVAAASEELAQSLTEVTRRIAEASQMARAAATDSARSNEIVESLAAAAKEIGNVVSLIQNVAEQTNLLALNATIEAARAGEAGKGFAVVASEVKSLANQTSKATGDIALQIQRIQSVAEEVVGAISGIAKSVERIDEGASAVASAAEQQSAATREISSNVQQAASGTREVSTNIAGVTEASSETGRVSREVLEASSELNRQADRLRGVVTRFVEEIKAA
ncbi:MAG: methyl-accepting chemotaxis protein [Alphaproteobacteria bacterium]|nr:MAG: methyl-accepting chemotaxis protein [Alphaproteobacteria bacterium]